MDQQKWDERYAQPEFAYGKGPNDFFKEWLQKMEPGSILMPADGEGRNGVYAAQLGWKVTSVDLSTEGKTKALQLAREHNVAIDYIVGDLAQLRFPKESFDAIGLIYAHFSAATKSALHRQLDTYLKPGGTIVLEAFSKNHLMLSSIDPRVGGPREIDMLFSVEELKVDFPNYDIKLLAEQEAHLEEGKYHNGNSLVIRMVALKKS